MMSLFSSFDLFFFYKNLIFLYFILFMIFFKSFLLCSTNSFFNIIILSLSSFFVSLKPKSFSKMSNNIFLGMFFSLVMMNFFSVFSYNFPFSSQVSVVFSISLSFWFMMLFFNLYSSFNKFLYHFIPEGTPMGLTFILFLIELISNLIRPLTLMVRLVANILAGHLLMILLSKLIFIFPLFYFSYVILNIVEIFVSLIQSYIFTTMLVLYFSEV